MISLVDDIDEVLKNTGRSAFEIEQFVSQVVSQRNLIEQDLSQVCTKQQEFSSKISDADAELIKSNHSVQLEIVAIEASRDAIKQRIEELETQLVHARAELTSSENHLVRVRQAGEVSKKHQVLQQDELKKQYTGLVAEASQDECELRGIQTIESLLKSLSVEISAAHSKIISDMQQTSSRCKQEHVSAMTTHCRHLVSSTSVMRRQLEFLNSEIADLDVKASKLQELGMSKELKSIPLQKQVRSI
jgi:chromosome segregation ATPase